MDGVPGPPINWGELLDPRRIRSELGLSQRQLADLLGLSPRAVQSWEQGWRTPSSSHERSLLLLLLAHRNGSEFGQLACWDFAPCPRERRQECIAHQCRQGHLCWFLTGTRCQGRRMRTWAEKKVVCGECEFMHRLVRGSV